MSTKISILSELTSILTKKEKRDTRVLVFSRQFKIGQLLKPFSGAKKKGKPMLLVLVAMILSRLGGTSIYAVQQTGYLGIRNWLAPICRASRNS